MAHVEVRDRIAASPDRVWELVRDFGGLQRWAAGIESVSVAGEGVGAVRTVTMPGGLALQERLEACDDRAHTLSYAIVGDHPLPFDGYVATIRLAPDGDGCRIDWSSRFTPRPGADGQAAGLVEAIYRGGIAGLKKALGA